MLIKSLNIALPAVNLFSLALLQYHILVKIQILPLETCCQVLLGFSKTPVEVQSTWRTRIPSIKMVVLIRCKPWSVPGHIFAPEARTFSCFLEFSLNLFVVWLLSSFQIILSISCMHVCLSVSNRTEFRWIMEFWQSAAWTWLTLACSSAWQRTSTVESLPMPS